MSACFRQRVIAFFLECKLPNERLAKNMVTWAHSGFSVDASVRIPAGSTKAREALAQYIPGPTAGRRPARGVRPPVSLQKLLVDEGGTDTVVYHAPYSDYFKTDTKVFPVITEAAQVLKILRYLIKTGEPPPRGRAAAPPGLDPASLN
jgi:hypothetical protein